MFSAQGVTHPPVRISGEPLVLFGGRAPKAEPYIPPAPKRGKP